MTYSAYGLARPTEVTDSLDRSVDRDGEAARTDTDNGLTETHSPESVVLRNASPAGGQADFPEFDYGVEYRSATAEPFYGWGFTEAAARKYAARMRAISDGSFSACPVRRAVGKVEKLDEEKP